MSQLSGAQTVDNRHFECEKKDHSLTSGILARYLSIDEPGSCSGELEAENKHSALEYRGVILHGLPEDTIIESLTALIRGGKVQSLNLSKPEKGSLNGEIYFWTEAGALNYAQFLNSTQLIIGGNLVHAELFQLDPIDPDWRTVIDNEDASRPIIIHNFSTDSAKFGACTHDLTHCFQKLGIAQWEIEGFASAENGQGGPAIRFASISAAKEVKEVLVALGYSVAYERDPCMGDVEDLKGCGCMEWVAVDVVMKQL
ncbi:hypothetical protein RUND412_010920 [Rhizina undulata]